MNLENGVYKATVKDYGISESKDGAPMVFIQFSVYHDESLSSHQDLPWYGSLKNEQSIEITLKALMVCGLKNGGIRMLARGPESSMLDQQTPIPVTIANEEYQGKMYTKVKYIGEGVGGPKRADNECLRKIDEKGVLFVWDALTKSVPLPPQAPGPHTRKYDASSIPF